MRIALGQARDPGRRRLLAAALPFTFMSPTGLSDLTQAQGPNATSTACSALRDWLWSSRTPRPGCSWRSSFARCCATLDQTRCLVRRAGRAWGERDRGRSLSARTRTWPVPAHRAASASAGQGQSGRPGGLSRTDAAHKEPPLAPRGCTCAPANSGAQHHHAQPLAL